MSNPAKVHSLESIETVRNALTLFDERVSDALAEIGAEIRRMLEWLEHDRPRYWRGQVRIATDKLHEAQQALHRCLMFPIANERPSCYEERMELKKAQARLEYCQEKSERVRHWQQSIRHELFEYEGRISQLMRLVEADVPQSIGVLTRILRRLEEYQSLRSREPSAAYSDVSMVKDIWNEECASEPTEAGAPETAAAGTSADSGGASTPSPQTEVEDDRNA